MGWRWNAALLLLMTVVHTSQALTCAPCAGEACRTDLSEGEACGGACHPHGRCGPGLFCKRGDRDRSLRLRLGDIPPVIRGKLAAAARTGSCAPVPAVRAAPGAGFNVPQQQQEEQGHGDGPRRVLLGEEEASLALMAAAIPNAEAPAQQQAQAPAQGHSPGTTAKHHRQQEEQQQRAAEEQSEPTLSSLAPSLGLQLPSTRARAAAGLLALLACMVVARATSRRKRALSDRRLSTLRRRASRHLTHLPPLDRANPSPRGGYHPPAAQELAGEFA